MKAEKAPGHDWSVYYRDGDDPLVLRMAVFGVMTAEKAIEEARYSLGAGGNEDYEIVAVVRDDISTEMLRSAPAL